MASDLLLRDVREDDLPIFFEQRLDSEANYLAAFTAEDPADRDAFTSRWNKILLVKSSSLHKVLIGLARPVTRF